MRAWLDVDLGELADEPEELYRLATMVNVACGGHAGDDASMARAVALADRHGARIAAHPSYPDRAGFGRATMVISADDLRDAVAAQCAALRRAVESAPRADAPPSGAAPREGIGPRALSVVKLHGALYHDASRDAALADAVIEGAARGLGTVAITWVGPPRGELWRRARERGGSYLREGFADRGARPDGSLVPRGQPGALIEDPARAAGRALELSASGEIEAICVHSDTRGAVEIARAVRAALERAGMLESAAPSRRP